MLVRRPRQAGRSLTVRLIGRRDNFLPRSRRINSHGVPQVHGGGVEDCGEDVCGRHVSQQDCKVPRQRQVDVDAEVVQAHAVETARQEGKSDQIPHR